MVKQTILSFKERATAFEEDANRILNIQKEIKSKDITLSELYKKLDHMEFEQRELFRQSLDCIGFSLYRAAILMGWLGFIDLLIHHVLEFGIDEIHRQYPNWKNYKTEQSLCEKLKESQFIEAAHKFELITNSEKGMLKGILARRNACAHPTGFYITKIIVLGDLDMLLRVCDKLI